MSTHVHDVHALDPAERSRLGRRAQLLAAASVSYNVVEAVIAITAGVVAGSVALVGFGLDSIVEVSSGLIILWQFRHPLPESRERTALRLMAVSFFALAAYVAVESIRALGSGQAPDPSPVGIALAAASLAIMPFLSWAQRRTGQGAGFQRRRRGLDPDDVVHLPLRRPAGRPRPQRGPRLALGRPTRGPGHRRGGGQGGPGRLAGRGVLRFHRRGPRPRAGERRQRLW